MHEIVEIRRYHPSDLDAIIDAWQAASVVAHPFLSREFIEAERSRIAELYMPNAETWVCVADGQVRGFVALLDDEVGALFVHPDHHGKGLGRQLMDKAVSLRGRLVLDVFRDNHIGRTFYDRYGFRACYEHRHEETGHIFVRMNYDPETSNP